MAELKILIDAVQAANFVPPDKTSELVEKLLAYAGLDPSVYQSGNFQASKTRMSKRGSKTLRYALINAAHNVVKNNATFKTYYDKKMAEGRSHYNALGHCAGKLVRIVWKMLTDELTFSLE